MPYYDYRCSECGHLVKDFKKSINDPHLVQCPKCKKESLLQSYENHDSIVQYKGKGWMKTDGQY
jgi:putative FmdB family regulatory protein